MRGAFGKPQGTVARVHIGQIIMSVRAKDNHKEKVIEALRRAKFKYPGRQKVCTFNPLYFAMVTWPVFNHSYLRNGWLWKFQTSERHLFRVLAVCRYHWRGSNLFPVCCVEHSTCVPFNTQKWLLLDLASPTLVISWNLVGTSFHLSWHRERADLSNC